jgi:hypothetical protein
MIKYGINYLLMDGYLVELSYKICSHNKANFVTFFYETLSSST